ncbi:MAG: chorismate synthase [Deltaproteobacteria bacterium]|nr:MAG: chorismate synthase [Deltaproteobacteria bacterium]
MGGNTFGRLFRITTFGESHGESLGVVVDGCPSGIEFDISKIQSLMDRRKPGSPFVSTSTERKESDIVHVISGVFEGKTTGTPITLILKNNDCKSSAYNDLKDVFRPGHGDITYFLKYGIRDWRGGGRASARETAARVAGGGVAMLLLEKEGISVSSFTKEIGGIKAEQFYKKHINENPFFMPDNEAAKKVAEKVKAVKKSGDSLGGIVEISVKSAPEGLGEPVFDKLDADLAKAMMSIGAVKGVEIGRGFEASKLKGSENNDEITSSGFKTNNSGGILAGISNGDDIIIRIAVKPIPSISLSQETIDEKYNKRNISIKGRHDICAIPRINVVAEAMASIVIADHFLRAKTCLC